MSLLEGVKNFDRQTLISLLNGFRSAYRGVITQAFQYVVAQPIKGLLFLMVLLVSLGVSYFAGSNIPMIENSRDIPKSGYVVSEGVGQETPAVELDNQGKQIATSWVDIFKDVLKSADPMLNDFINLTPQYIDASGSEIPFTIGSVASPKPVFDSLMGISTSIIILFLVLDSIKTITKGGSLKQTGKRYLIGIILLFSTGTLLILSIRFANALTTDVFQASSENGQSILGGYVEEHLDSLGAAYEAEDASFWGWVTGEDRYNPIETLQAYVSTFFALLPTLIIFALLFLIIIQMAWRWAMLYILTPLAPLAQVFYMAPFRNDITRKFWSTWISNLIHLPLFLLAYKLVVDGFLSNADNTSPSHTLIFIVSLFILWQINTQVGRIFGEFEAVSSSAFGQLIPQKIALEGVLGGTSSAVSGVRKSVSSVSNVVTRNIKKKDKRRTPIPKKKRRAPVRRSA